MSYYTLDHESIALYADVIPNSRFPMAELADENIPRLYTYLAEDATKAVLIIPGGGYARVALQHEGEDVAKRFQELGYHAFVLYYRLPKAELWEDAAFVPLHDAQQALQLIRKDYAPAVLGVVGFSAGGHLAATLVNQQSALVHSKIDFSVLVYPVITMKGPYVHKGSLQNLLGGHPSADHLACFSTEELVTKDTPPTFLVHAKDDNVVPIAHSVLYKGHLRDANVPHEYFFYETGGHGFGLINKTDARSWDNLVLDWIDTIV